MSDVGMRINRSWASFNTTSCSSRLSNFLISSLESSFSTRQFWPDFLPVFLDTMTVFAIDARRLKEQLATFARITDERQNLAGLNDASQPLHTLFGRQIAFKQIADTQIGMLRAEFKDHGSDGRGKLALVERPEQD